MKNALRSLTVNEDYRCFKKDDRFEFRPGINLLVGDQGTGKSTILQLLRGKSNKATVDVTGKLETASFDFERDNPRCQRDWNEKQDIMDQVAVMFTSHGQVNTAILNSLKTKKDLLFLMDEPDTALSMKSTRQFANNLKIAVDNGCQLILAVHNIIVIESVDEVLSLEHRKWMTSKEFIDSHR